MDKKCHFLETTFKEKGQRLDVVLSQAFQGLYTRSRLQALIQEGQVLLDGQICLKPAWPIKENQLIHLTIPEIRDSLPQAKEIPLDLLYEDADVLVLNKPAGMVVHPAPGHHEDTLVNALLAHCGESLSGIGGVKRPGLVHRLDKDTSGLMVVAKNDQAHQGLMVQFKDRSLQRVYQAVVHGFPSPSQGTIETFITRHPRDRLRMAVSTQSGKKAITHYDVLKAFSLNNQLGFSLVECRLATGRTHQIRVHLHHLGYPLVGDSLYGAPKKMAFAFPRQALHAVQLTFYHPKTQEKLTFFSDLPEDMKALIKQLSETV